MGYYTLIQLTIMNDQREMKHELTQEIVQLRERVAQLERQATAAHPAGGIPGYTGKKSYNEVELRHLAQRIVTAQEEERQRLSHELHDEAGQTLITLKMMLGLILMDLPLATETLSTRLKEVMKLADTTMERLRALAQDLRPPILDAVGFSPALEGLCHDFSDRTLLPISYTGGEIEIASDQIKVSLYRFLQEALTNIAKHAQASQIWVEFGQVDHFLKLRVKDNGCGFDIQAKQNSVWQQSGLGLLGMRERLELFDGWLQVDSQPNQGTELVAYIPLVID